MEKKYTFSAVYSFHIIVESIWHFLRLVFSSLTTVSDSKKSSRHFFTKLYLIYFIYRHSHTFCRALRRLHAFASWSCAFPANGSLSWIQECFYLRPLRFLTSLITLRPAFSTNRINLTLISNHKPLKICRHRASQLKKRKATYLVKTTYLRLFGYAIKVYKVRNQGATE